MGNFSCRFECEEEDETFGNVIYRFFRPRPSPRISPVLVRIGNSYEGSRVPYPLVNMSGISWNQSTSQRPTATVENNEMPEYEEVCEIRQPSTSSMVSQPLPSTANNPNERSRLAHSRPNDNIYANLSTIQEQNTSTQENPNLKDTKSPKGRGTFRRTKSPTIEPPKKNYKNMQFLIDLSSADALLCQFPSEPYRLENLETREYQNVQNQFRKTNKKCYLVKNIQKVNNPYLLLQYNLKKRQYVSKYGGFEEKHLFHGTKIDYVDSICANNFNWRYKDRQGGYRFGKGVAFSPFSNYATDHRDKSEEKVMFLVKVLIANKCVGNENTVVPPNIFDTTTNDMAQVFVKYEDNEFYPSYLIYYEGNEDV